MNSVLEKAETSLPIFRDVVKNSTRPLVPNCDLLLLHQTFKSTN